MASTPLAMAGMQQGSITVEPYIRALTYEVNNPLVGSPAGATLPSASSEFVSVYSPSYSTSSIAALASARTAVAGAALAAGMGVTSALGPSPPRDNSPRQPVGQSNPGGLSSSSLLMPRSPEMANVQAALLAASPRSPLQSSLASATKRGTSGGRPQATVSFANSVTSPSTTMADLRGRLAKLDKMLSFAAAGDASAAAELLGQPHKPLHVKVGIDADSAKPVPLPITTATVDSFPVAIQTDKFQEEKTTQVASHLIGDPLHAAVGTADDLKKEEKEAMTTAEYIDPHDHYSTRQHLTETRQNLVDVISGVEAQVAKAATMRLEQRLSGVLSAMSLTENKRKQEQEQEKLYRLGQEAKEASDKRFLDAAATAVVSLSQRLKTIDVKLASDNAQSALTINTLNQRLTTLKGQMDDDKSRELTAVQGIKVTLGDLEKRLSKVVVKLEANDAEAASEDAAVATREILTLQLQAAVFAAEHKCEDMVRRLEKVSNAQVVRENRYNMQIEELHHEIMSLKRVIREHERRYDEKVKQDADELAAVRKAAAEADEERRKAADVIIAMNNRLERDLNESNETCKALKEDKDRLMADLARANGVGEQLVEQKLRLEEERDGLKTTLEDRDATIATLTSEKTDLASRLETAAETAKTAVERMEEAEAALQRVEEEHQQTSARLEVAEQAKVDSGPQMLLLANTVNALSEDKRVLEDALQATKMELEERSLFLGTLKIRAEEGERTAKELAESKKQLVLKDASIVSLQNEIRSLMIAIDSLRQSQASAQVALEEERMNSRRAVSDAVAKMASSSKSYAEESDQKIISLESSLKAVRSDLEHARKDLSAERDKCRLLEKEVQSLQKDTSKAVEQAKTSAIAATKEKEEKLRETAVMEKLRKLEARFREEQIAFEKRFYDKADEDKAAAKKTADEELDKRLKEQEATLRAEFDQESKKKEDAFAEERKKALLELAAVKAEVEGLQRAIAKEKADKEVALAKAASVSASSVLAALEEQDAATGIDGSSSVSVKQALDRAFNELFGAPATANLVAAPAAPQPEAEEEEDDAEPAPPPPIVGPDGRLNLRPEAPPPAPPPKAKMTATKASPALSLSSPAAASAASAATAAAQKKAHRDAIAKVLQATGKADVKELWTLLNTPITDPSLKSLNIVPSVASELHKMLTSKMPLLLASVGASAAATATAAASSPSASSPSLGRSAPARSPAAGVGRPPQQHVSFAGVSSFTLLDAACVLDSRELSAHFDHSQAHSGPHKGGLRGLFGAGHSPAAGTGAAGITGNEPTLHGTFRLVRGIMALLHQLQSASS
jgi:hypothetical protein